MKDDIYEYDEVKPPRFGPPARLSDDDTVADIVRELRFNKEFNDHLEEIITKVIDKLIKKALK